MRMRSHRHIVVVPLLLAALLPVASCSSDNDNKDKELKVLAAASLTETFEKLETEFEEANEGVDVKLSFGSSTTLAEQANEGAPGDVLATADEKSMDLASEGGSLGQDAQQFATNELVLVVPSANPAKITGFQDFASSDWVRCDDEVPCGRVAVSLLDENDVTTKPVSREIDVKSVLAKVTTGEADAGFVYATDAVAAGDKVQVFEVPGAENSLNPYFVAPLAQSGDESLAKDWIKMLTSPKGLEILTRAGFGQP